MSKHRYKGQNETSQLELNLAESAAVSAPAIFKSASEGSSNVVAMDRRGRLASDDRHALDRILSLAKALPRRLD
jgi:hypothetical protein